MRRPLRVVIVASRFHEGIVDRMVDITMAYAVERGVKVVEVIRVPGSFEIPFVLQSVLRRKDVDAAVVLGSVIKGETDHDQIIMREVARKIMDLSLEHGKPVGLGVAGPGMTEEQAWARVDYGKRAIDAVLGSAKGGPPSARERTVRARNK